MDLNSLALSAQLSKAGWKVKIFAKELPVEEPHATIVKGKQLWRISLRTFLFMDRRPPPRDVSQAVIAAMATAINREWLIGRWNAVHPINPV